jgi:hypothetical protein
MNKSRRMLPVFAGVVSLVLAVSATALAAPVTVNLRVEGSTKTLFEGPISTEGGTFETSSSKGPHPCDYSENGHSENEKHEVFTNGGTPAGTPTTALRDAALSAGLAFNAEWFTSLNDFEVTQVGSDVNEEVAPYASWGYAVNDTTAPVGGCQIALAPGNEVLWAYNYFNLPHLLSLSGPSSVTVGVPFTVHVADGHSGEPLEGAEIGQLVSGVTSTSPSSPKTNAAGNATVTLGQVGTTTLKAVRTESVRSNGLAVSVDGEACAESAGNGTQNCVGIAPVFHPPNSPVVSDVAKVAGVKNGHVYSRRSAPRLLAGVVDVPVGGTLRQVRISLQRRYHGRCFDFSGSRESFVRAKKCGSADFFSVGGSESFSYLLPARLPKGSYVYDIEGIDSTGQATKLVSGISHVVFQVK